MGTRILFITGTDTGVGKTLLTALLLCHLRARGARAFALKPFCSGGRGDAQLLYRLQDGDLTLDEINPFYFPEPVAPLVSGRKHKTLVDLNRVVEHIDSIASRLSAFPSTPPSKPASRNAKSEVQNYLLIEGSGGLLVPLGDGYTVRDLIARLSCETIIVSRNRLGTINHTQLTIEALRRSISHSARTDAPFGIKVVLMDAVAKDFSFHSNRGLLSQIIAPTPLFRLPALAPRPVGAAAAKRNARKLSRVLARILSDEAGGQASPSSANLRTIRR